MHRLCGFKYLWGCIGNRSNQHASMSTFVKSTVIVDMHKFIIYKFEMYKLNIRKLVTQR